MKLLTTKPTDKKIGETKTKLATRQHALEETKNWYGDIAIFVSSIDPWFNRGGVCGYPGNAGVFYFGRNSGGSGTPLGSRLSVTIN